MAITLLLDSYALAILSSDGNDRAPNKICAHISAGIFADTANKSAFGKAYILQPLFNKSVGKCYDSAALSDGQRAQRI
jgi:hypothetical protein